MLHLLPPWLPPQGQSNATTAVAPCNATDVWQHFRFERGLLRAVASGLCVEARCEDVAKGCRPLPLAACDPGNALQQFEHRDGALRTRRRSPAGCVDVWNGGSGPDVGLYECTGTTNQKWHLEASEAALHVVSPHGALCLMAGPVVKVCLVRLRNGVGLPGGRGGGAWGAVVGGVVGGIRTILN